MNISMLILTDSGGIQEEGPAIGKPVIVMRDITERPEAVEAGTVKLTGAHADKIIAAVNELITQPEEYEKMIRTGNPYGDGHANRRPRPDLADDHGWCHREPRQGAIPHGTPG